MKDPAFLFYPNDWQGGTMTMSRHTKGCYLDLLVAQFNSGPLSLEEIKNVLGSDFGPAWPLLVKKFSVDPAGKYFNERLAAEKTKREAHSAKQKERINKRWNKEGKPSGNTAVLPLENETENRNENVDRKWGTGENPRNPADEQLLASYRSWTDQIIAGNDLTFDQLLCRDGIKPNGQLNHIARDHLAKVNRYPSQRPPNHLAFCESLLGHIHEKLNHHATHQQNRNPNTRSAEKLKHNPTFKGKL